MSLFKLFIYGAEQLKGDLDDFVRIRMEHVNKASILITFAWYFVRAWFQAFAGHRIQYSIIVNVLFLVSLTVSRFQTYLSLMLSVCSFDFKDLRLQGDDSLWGCDLHGKETGDVWDCRNDSLLLSGSSNGSFTIVRTPFHGKCLRFFNCLRLSIRCRI